MQFSNRKGQKGRRLASWLVYDAAPDYLSKAGRIQGDGVDGVNAEWMDRCLMPVTVKDGPKPRGNGTGRLAEVHALPTTTTTTRRRAAR